jgi:hypothetical protein
MGGDPTEIWVEDVVTYSRHYPCRLCGKSMKDVSVNLYNPRPRDENRYEAPAAH